VLAKNGRRGLSRRSKGAGCRGTRVRVVQDPIVDAIVVTQVKPRAAELAVPTDPIEERMERLHATDPRSPYCD
jgi:hypothetical protein